MPLEDEASLYSLHIPQLAVEFQPTRGVLRDFVPVTSGKRLKTDAEQNCH